MKDSSKKIHYIILTTLIIIIICISCFIFISKPNSNSLDNNIDKSKTDISSETKDQLVLEEKDPFEGLPVTNDNIGIPVLYYHSIEPSEKNELILSPDRLREQLQYIKDSGYTTLTMSQVYQHLSNNSPIPEKSILLTFDDGYMDNYTYAYPILKELNMNATIFLMTVGVDEGYYISSEQIKEMSDNGIDIQSHTINHVHLNELTYEEQLKELKESRQFISNITEKEVISVSYPYGDYNEDTLKAVKDSGYSLAFGVDRGKADRTDNILALNRIYVSSLDTMDQFIYNLENTAK